MKIKVCHIISDLDWSFFVEAIGKFLDNDRYEVVFVFLAPEPPPLVEILREKGHLVEFVKFDTRRDLPKAVFQLRRLLASIKPEIVHTHMVSASLAGLTAAFLCGIKKRVHTRHHSSECHIYYKHGVYYDKYISRLSKRIVAISQAVVDVLTETEGVKPEKVHLIGHGMDLAEFKSDPVVERELNQKYELAGRFPVIGVISRFVHWKGVQHIIPAFAKLTEKYPEAKLVLANAIGNFTAEIKALLRENLEPSQYVLIEFEPRVFELYKNFDIFVHVPITREFEAFGLIYVEALAFEVPSVFTLSGIADEFIEDKKNALVVPFSDSNAIYRAMLTILEDDELRKTITAQGKSDVFSLFSAELMAEKLDLMYSSM